MRSPLIVAVILGMTTLPGGAGGKQSSVAPGQRSYYAAVFLNRSIVSSGGAPNVGVFRRGASDTQWINVYRPNLLTFGIQMWGTGPARRFYVAGGSGLHRSLDGGKTWRILTDWHVEEVLSMALDPVDQSVIYIATPSGLFRSIDDGKTWQKKTRGMKRQFIKMVVIDHSDRMSLFAASEDDLYRTTDQGEHWKPLHEGVPGILTILQDSSDPKHLFVGTEDNGLRISLDGGRTWKPCNGLPATAIYSICQSPDGRTLFAGGYKTGLWKSVDDGVSWALLWQTSELEAIFTIFVDPVNVQHMMVGTSGRGIFESFDEGKSWHAAGLDGCHVKQIEVYPQNEFSLHLF